ncbi:hypothetical protein GCM10023196_006740 [Actinoallomurus vinaceus]|uniref:Protein kinase domain-containing protein n=1 Tax=Actinoallomurus vinaceus TaxID=1080074 RepID=A0ABP8U568_9ACTN
MPETEPLRSEDPSVVGPYRLTGRLGMGGQGVVYLASAPDGTNVAVKLLREELAADPRVRERFMKEIAAARRVDPFCIAQVLDASAEGSRPYVVTEYVDGPSLQQSGPRDGTAALQRLAVATATALTAIHDAGIVHRDFKPSNVLLGPDGPRVIDFGIARDTEAPLTLTSTIMGTPAYMAPEQFEGRSIDAPADVFAWGSVMAFAANGRPPFGADSFPAIMNRVLQGEPDLGDLPEPLRSLVVACLAKDPARRPTMQDVMLRLVSARSAATGPQQAAATPPPPASLQPPPVTVPQPLAGSPQPPPGPPPQSPAGPQRTPAVPPPPGPQPPFIAPRPVAGSLQPPTGPPMPGSAPSGRRPDAARRRLVLLAGAGAAAVLAGVVVAGAILWPGMSEAEDPGKGSGRGKAEAAHGTGQETRNPTASGGPGDGVSGKPSAGPSSPNSTKTPGGPSPKPSAGKTQPKTRSARPTTTRSSGTGGGGTSGGRPGLVLTAIGTKSGSCYTKGGYQYQINYPNARHWVYVDGDEVDSSSERYSKVGPETFWGSGNHVVKLYMQEPNIVRTISFTMC